MVYLNPHLPIIVYQKKKKKAITNRDDVIMIVDIYLITIFIKL